MMNLHVLFCNPIINCGLFAWFLAQAVKVVLYAFLARKLDLGRFVSSGGMPSSHSALVVACTTAIGRLYGVEGPLFALAVMVSVVVMYDACNVRRSAGDTARLVNKLLEHMEQLTAEEFADRLREVMGHTPMQVLVGALLGFGVGLLI